MSEKGLDLSLNEYKEITKPINIYFKMFMNLQVNLEKLIFQNMKKLNNDSFAYGDSKTLTESLEYDISLEKEKNYKDMSIVEVIKNITDFTSSI